MNSADSEIRIFITKRHCLKCKSLGLISTLYSEQKLKLHHQKMLEEEEINKKLSQMKAGEWVTYGNEIQLMHFDSQGKFR